MKNIGPIPEDELVREVLSGTMSQNFANAMLDFTKNTIILDAKLLDDDGVMMLTIERHVKGSIICRNDVNKVRFTFTCHEANRQEAINKTRFRILNARAVVINDENLGNKSFPVNLIPEGSAVILSFTTDSDDSNNLATNATIYRLGDTKTFPVWDYLDYIIQRAIDLQINKDPGNYAIKSFGMPKLD